jgi:hypothetical protein
MIDNFYGFDEIFIDNTNILYWRNDENQIILENYSLQTQSNTKIAENIIKPQTDGTIFVGLTVVQVDGEISRKLTVFDLKGNSKVLEDENISEFKINHF